MVEKKQKSKNRHVLGKSGGGLKNEAYEFRIVRKEKNIPHQAPHGFGWFNWSLRM
jgi:hypothetical protein